MARNIIYSDFDGSMEQQADGDIKKDTEMDAIENSLMNIIETIQGTRRMLPEFAIGIHTLLFEPISPEIARQISEMIIEGIEYWDDRIQISNFRIEPRYDDNMYKCTMSYITKLTTEIETIDFVIK